MGTKRTSNASNSSNHQKHLTFAIFTLSTSPCFGSFSEVSHISVKARNAKPLRHTPNTEVSTFASLVDIDFPPLVVGLIELQGFFHGLYVEYHGLKNSENGL